MSEGLARPHVGLENTAELLHSLVVFQDVDILGRLVDDVVPDLVGQRHVLFDQDLLLRRVRRRRDHVADGLVKGVDLLGLQVADDRVDVAQEFIDKGHHFADLDLNELPATLLGDLDERVARHVLDALVGLVHELEQLVDDGLEEAPMSTQKTGVLADNVHNVGGDDGLVVLALLLLAKAEKILDHGD